MCSPATCRKCGKSTWSGCGQHVKQVMAGVPKSRRCPGHQQEPSAFGRFVFKLLGGNGS